MIGMNDAETVIDAEVGVSRRPSDSLNSVQSSC
jgi:hypothetical protein